MLAKSTSDMSKKEKLKPYQCKCRLDELVPSPVLRNKDTLMTSGLLEEVGTSGQGKILPHGMLEYWNVTTQVIQVEGIR